MGKVGVPHPQAYAVRKIIKARRAISLLASVVVASLVMSVTGLALYVAVYPSSVVAMEAFVWFVEALSFTGILIAFHMASNKALRYRHVFEVLRVEALAALLLALLGIGLTLLVVYNTLNSAAYEPTPILLALYPFASALTSAYLEKRLKRVFRSIRVYSVHAIAYKLGLDVFFEIAGSISIVVSNLLHNPLAEKLVVLVTGVYIVYGLLALANDAAKHLVGIATRQARRIQNIVNRIVFKHTGRRPVITRVVSMGTFSEVEVWVTAHPEIRLREAHEVSMRIAREIVARVPEVIRAIVIVVPYRIAVKAKKRRKPRRVHVLAKGGSPTPPRYTINAGEFGSTDSSKTEKYGSNSG